MPVPAQLGTVATKHMGKNTWIDPENDEFIVETSLPTPIWQGLC